MPPAGAPTYTLDPLASGVAAKRARDATRVPAVSHRIGTIDRRAIGPFVARSGESALAAWVVPSERGNGQELIVVPLDGAGAPLAEPRVVATPREATSLVVRPSGGAQGGWIIAFSALLDRGESLTVLGLAADGSSRTPPSDVARTSDHIKWADVIPTSRGAVGIWVEETTAGDANIVATALDGDGKARGMPVRVARGVDRWQAVPFADGVGLALVTTDAHDPAAAGRLSWLRLDASGRAQGRAAPVGVKSTVSGDVDAVAAPDGLVLAWTDRTGEDAQVMLALVEPSGQVRGPVPAMNAVGGSSLVGLASGPAGVAIGWEEPSARGRPTRTLHLASVSTTASPSGAGLAAQPVTALTTEAGAAPELTATAGGFGVLTLAHACVTGSGAGSCSGPIVPTYVRFGAHLEPLQTEPIVVGDGEATTALAWGLRCDGERCLALAATSETPTPIFAVALPPRGSPFATPALPPPPADAPRVTGVETIASGKPYDEVAAAQLGDAVVVATLASSPSEPGDREPIEHGHDRTRDRPRRSGASLAVRTLGDDGRPRGPVATLTSRAVATGGIAITAGGAPDDGAVVVWVGGEDRDPQVHVAHLDRRGHRSSEVQLTTRARGDVSGVAAAWMGDGWLVAWVDAREGNGEVYATRVSRDLERVAREERVTRAPGDAGDVALAVRGNAAWIAWSDPRESPGEGLSDIYAASLDVRDARRTSDEVRVLASSPHSRSPQLVPTSDGGVLVAWIEDAATGLEGPGAAMVARLDASARVVSSPETLPMSAAGRPTSITLTATREGARAVIVRASHEVLTLDALVLGVDGKAASRPWALLDLDAPASFDVDVAMTGDTLFVNDVGRVPGDHHVRRVTTVWRR